VHGVGGDPAAIHGSKLEANTPWGILCGQPNDGEGEMRMCRQVMCRRCGKPTWSGCGQHVNQVMSGVPKAKRCQCPPAPSLVERLFGGRKKTPA